MNPSIHITSVVQPAGGAVFVCYCPTCKATHIVFANKAARPKGLDYWFIPDYCPENLYHGLDNNPSHDFTCVGVAIESQ